MSSKQMLFGATIIVSALVLGGCSSPLTTSVKTGDTEVSTSDTKVMVTMKDEQQDTEMKKETAMPKKNIVVIFDASGSMNTALNGEKKIDIAKRSLNAYIDTLSPEVNLSLLAYGHVGSSSQADKAVSCSTVEEKYYLGPVNAMVAKDKVSALSAKGWTPITNALSKADALLATHPGEDNRILLVSDGEETCGGDPLAIAQKIKLENARIDVIGFDVQGKAAEALKNISVQGGGGYISVKNGNDFSVVIKVQTDAANVNLDYGMIQASSGDMKVNVKPGEMPDVKMPSGYGL
jgi:Ca-activated chloride channel family protein